MAATQPVITQTAPPTPASLSVYASQGDLTYCVTTASSTVMNFSLTCRKSGVTQFTPTTIIASITIKQGDLCWIFNYDVVKTNVVHVQVAANQRTAGQITGQIIGSQFDATWPVGTPTAKP